MKLKVKSIEHLKELADTGGPDVMEHFEGYLLLCGGFLHQNVSFYYEKDKDSWEVVNESDDFEVEYDSTEQMLDCEHRLIKGLKEGELWKY